VSDYMIIVSLCDTLPRMIYAAGITRIRSYTQRGRDFPCCKFYAKIG